MSERPAEDVNLRLLHALRDYAALKIGRDEATRAYARVLREKGISGEAAHDPRAWVSLEAFSALADELAALVGGEIITDAVTWIVPARRDLSAMSLSAIVTPRLFFQHLDRARAFFARHVRFDMTLEGPSRARARLFYREGVPRLHHSCQVARGVLHAVPLLFDLPPAEVEETACFARGAESCEFEVRWRREAPYAWLGAGAGAAVGILGWFALPGPLWLLAPAIGWLLGRELRMARLRRAMTRISEEHRRVLADNEREFKRRYEQVRAINEELESRVLARTAALEKTMMQLREQNASLRATIAEMERLKEDLLDAGGQKLLGEAVQEFAHEIKNPLTWVIMNLDYIEASRSETTDVAELEDATREMRAGVDRMRSVIGWFLDLYRSVPSQLGTRDLAADVRSAVEPLGRSLGRVTMRLELEPARIAGHEGQLGQVAANLVTNAAQAMPNGGEVRVKVTTRGGKAILSVGDDGPGIPKDLLARVFQRGFTTKEVGRGSGLGLYIARTIVERHAGRISVRSELGKGATFEVELPLLAEERSADETEAKVGPSPSADTRSGSPSEAPGSPRRSP